MRALSLFLLSIILICTGPGISASRKFSDALPKQSERPGNFSTDSLMKLMQSLPLHHIEGIWQLTADGAKVAIIRCNDTDQNGTSLSGGYEILLIESPDRALRPGTRIGLLSPTAVKSTYEARIYTRSIGSRLYSPARFTLRLSDDDSRLVFEQIRSKYSFNPFRILPYSWRLGITRRDSRPSVQGAVRVYPLPERPLEPFYL